jgi:membrane-bound ClpP family serine protease
MEWFVVLSLIVIGLILIVVEVIFVPGTTLVGFIGFGLVLLGQLFGFRYFGNNIGWIIVAGTAMSSAIIFFWVFRSKPWQLFALKTSIKSKVNEGIHDGLVAGAEGIARSALRPSGKAELGGKVVEVTTQGSYLESGTRVRIIKISPYQILVETIN